MKFQGDLYCKDARWEWMKFKDGAVLEVSRGRIRAISAKTADIVLNMHTKNIEEFADIPHLRLVKICADVHLAFCFSDKKSTRAFVKYLKSASVPMTLCDTRLKCTYEQNNLGVVGPGPHIPLCENERTPLKRDEAVGPCLSITEDAQREDCNQALYDTDTDFSTIDIPLKKLARQGTRKAAAGTRKMRSFKVPEKSKKA